MNGGIPSQTGAVLDEEARSAVTVAFWGVRLSGYAGEIADRAIAALAPHVAALVARARAEGAAEERERVLGLINAKAERYMGAVVVGLRMAADTIRDDSTT